MGKHPDQNLYHVEVYMPDWLMDKAKRFRVSPYEVSQTWHYSKDRVNATDKKHSFNAKDVENALKRLNNGNVEIFEVGEHYKILDKVVFRCVMDSNPKDHVCVVVSINDMIPTVVTAYVNDKNDKHTTLNRSKYVQPPKDNSNYKLWGSW